ncbi:unnamed protein product [Hermetia illucens]|uniref:U3 small nucleolar RNA-associated protein 18 homolog n=1 Tax=Hermetia illucens TaxID=343691 RepID=A0A7R8U9Q8_HERIL|nr:U3 small nucleolar RNA-associated protein 18 homolog [Hermetia illucens]CAD7076777.1 unnamed protein product [Hermetia illucens]
MDSDEHSDSDAELKEILEEENKKEQEAESSKTAVERAPSPSDDDPNDGAKSGKKGRKRDAAQTEYEKYLEKLVFGDKTALLENLKKAAGEDDESVPKKKTRKPAWQDSDDEEFRVADVVRPNKFNGSLKHLDTEKKYSELLKSRFQRLQATPKWADLDREPEEDSDEELLKTVGHLANKSTGALPANNLDFKRLKDLNRATYAEGSITAVQFHPTSTVALVTGFSGIASIYSIDGQKNEKLHNVQFQNFPIKCAKMLPNGLEVIIGGSRQHFFSYDLMSGEASRVPLPKMITKLDKFEVSPCGKYLATCGRFGEVYILDVSSKELLHTFQQTNPCSALQFTENSSKLIAHSTGSDVTIFDMRQERVEHVFTDEGCITGKALSLSPNGRLLATGSNEGVVNVYNYSDVVSSKTPEPEKIIYNLTTSVSCVKFNHSSEILGICSESVAGAIRAFHFPTGTAFANFPGFQADVGSIRTMDFSPGSGYLALGSTGKKVPLFRLKHFSNY